MKAVQFSDFRGPDGLELIDAPKPRPKAGEVLVRVRASGVNYFETLMLRDRYAVTPVLPMIPGVEVAGEVEAVGKDVRSVVVGARVAVPMFAIGRGSGGYVEYLAADAASVVPIPDDLPFESAVALMVQGLTALHLVRRSRPEGKATLVNAAAGGVGSLLVQLARTAGASPLIAAAGAPRKLQAAKALGADIAIDYSRPGWSDRVREASGGNGADIIYETIGGAHTKALLAALAPGGALIFGALGRFDLASADLEEMFSRNQSLTGFALLPLLDAAGVKADLDYLYRIASAGTLTVLKGESHALERAADAHRALESRDTIGKVVLTA